MGTKIQSNRYLSGHCSIWGLNESVNKDILPLYHDGKAGKNDQHYDPVLTQTLRMGGNLGYEMEKVRKIILEHESTFRHQLQELHRLYGRQREIMNEFKKREVKNCQMESESSRSSSFSLHISCDATTPTWRGSHTSLLHSLLGQASALQQNAKGKTMLGPFYSKDDGSSETFEAPNSNNKLLSRRVLDLAMPADRHISHECKKLEKSFCGFPGIKSSSTTQIDQFVHNKDLKHHQNGDALWSNNLCIKRENQLADLNEPVLPGENSVPAIVVNSGDVSSTGIGREQLRIGFKSTIMSKDTCPFTRDACSMTSEAELRKDEYSTSDQGMAKKPIRKRLFGVYIFDGDDNQVFTDSSMVNCIISSDKRGKDLLPRPSREEAPPKSFDSSAFLNWKSDNIFNTINKISHVAQDVISGNNSVNTDCENEQNNPKASSFCSMGTEYCGQLTRTNKNPHHLNLDSLQSGCQQFFQKSKTPSLSSQISIQKQETSLHMFQEPGKRNIAVDGDSIAKISNHFSVSSSEELSFAVISSEEIYAGSNSNNNSGQVPVERAISKDELKVGDIVVENRIKNSLSGSGQLIDLNLSLTEDEDPSLPSLPSTMLGLAKTEIDLQTPIKMDTETNLSPGELEGPYDEELSKIAAEAIVIISSSTSNVATPEPLEALTSDHLSWFAELACSYKFDDWNNSSEVTVDGVFLEDMIPEGMDYFEFMTLRLKDEKEDNYHYNPHITENENEHGEDTIVPTQSRRLRKGQTRKGRQRKDFQRDILPAIVTLSKHEVVADFQTFEELFKSSGCEWKSNFVKKTTGKNTRRKRSLNSGVSTNPGESDAICYSPEQQLVSKEAQVEEKALSGWGKRTRRLPRQRYMNGCPIFQFQP